MRPLRTVAVVLALLLAGCLGGTPQSDQTTEPRGEAPTNRTTSGPAGNGSAPDGNVSSSPQTVYQNGSRTVNITLIASAAGIGLAQGFSFDLTRNATPVLLNATLTWSSAGDLDDEIAFTLDNTDESRSGTSPLVAEFDLRNVTSSTLEFFVSGAGSPAGVMTMNQIQMDYTIRYVQTSGQAAST